METRRDGVIAPPYCHRGSPRGASSCIDFTRRRSVVIPVVDKSSRRWDRDGCDVVWIQLYAFLTLVAAFVYNCPYQTPPSLAIKSVVRYISRNNSGVIDSLSSVCLILGATWYTIATHLAHLGFVVSHPLARPSPRSGPCQCATRCGNRTHPNLPRRTR